MRFVLTADFLEKSGIYVKEVFFWKEKERGRN